MSHIKNDWTAVRGLLHHTKAEHIDDEVIVAVARAALT
ncbi:Uncharacterised protein [Vibrio cholerae]|nr:Uncharacterised protein [Vibrio cholerae]